MSTRETPTASTVAVVTTRSTTVVSSDRPEEHGCVSAARMAQPDASVPHLFLHPETWYGLCIYALSAVCWLWVLARAQLSLAYPILSLTFPIVLSLSAFFFAEVISPMRWAGVGIIVLGVSLLART